MVVIKNSKSAFIKDIFREIRFSFSRFLSIFAILAIGCGFFAGVKATCPDMQQTAYNYFVEHNLMDISLVSSYGVTKDDAEAVNRLGCVSGVMPAYSKDVIYNYDESSIVVRLFSYNTGYEDNLSYYLNRPNVREGRLPEKSGEIALEVHEMMKNQFKIGQTIEISVPSGEEISDSLATDTYTIVGVVDLPLYIGYTRDTTTVGNGKVNTNAIICESDFTLEYYTELYVTVDGAIECDPFSSDYVNLVEGEMLKIEEAFEASVQSRYENIISKAQIQISSAKSSLDFVNHLANSDLEELALIRANLNNDIIDLEKSYNNAVENENVLANVIKAKLMQSKNRLEQLDGYIYAVQEGNTEVISEYEAQIDEYTQMITEFESQLASVAEPAYFNTTRNDHTDYSSYKSDTERIDAIAKVFPVFFILVAALVCLTTMTRMIEEQRTQIGTYKALGYSSVRIISKYLIYALSAAVSGAFFGMALGFKAFPKIIFECYKLMYNIESIIAPFKWGYALACAAVAIVCVSVTVILACANELKAAPASLMRPKSPKAGKRVFLETIPIIWNKVSFLMKVTIRNLFRYKKRFLMTVIGIAGCTALIITGFGLKNSIASIVDEQFTKIFVYDGAIVPQETDAQTMQDIKMLFDENDQITDYVDVFQATADCFSEDGVVNSVNLIVPHNLENLDSFINLVDGYKKLSLDDNGVIITEKMSMLLDCEVGDTIKIKLPDDFQREVRVSYITDCYALHYIYMTPSFYNNLFEKSADANTFLISIDEKSDPDLVAQSLLTNESILAVTMINDTAQAFIDMINSLNAIVLVLILCAGALAFVVLYNLGNINITERVREIATIKVLGFYDGEVSSYIYRESFFSAFIGIVVGWVLGIFLHRFVVVTAEVDLVMFERSLRFMDVLFASIITVVFTVIVNFVLHFKLRKISMVESLKTIE